MTTKARAIELIRALDAMTTAHGCTAAEASSARRKRQLLARKYEVTEEDVRQPRPQPQQGAQDATWTYDDGSTVSVKFDFGSEALNAAFAEQLLRRARTRARETAPQPKTGEKHSSVAWTGLAIFLGLLAVESDVPTLVKILECIGIYVVYKVFK